MFATMFLSGVCRRAAVASAVLRKFRGGMSKPRTFGVSVSEGKAFGGFGGCDPLSASGDIVDGCCAFRTQLVRARGPHHGSGVGADLRGGDIWAIPLGVLLQEVGDVGGESQHGHRDVETPGDGE